MASKRIAAGAYEALIEALAVVFWNKAPQERFLRFELREHPELLVRLPFGALKRDVSAALVAYLAAHEDHYQPVTLDLMQRVAAMDRFPNLEQQTDKAHLVEAATEAVAELRRWIGRYSALVESHERLAAERVQETAREVLRRSTSARHEQLKRQFLGMHEEPDHQQRGRSLETLLNELFALYDLNPRRSFCIAGEQIDGAFTFNTDDYILEAKWEKAPAAREDVDVLDSKVRRRGKNTLGLFVAVSGFSVHAVNAHSSCGTGLVFMDGTDLFNVLDERIRLDELLDAKRRHAAETGNPYLRAADTVE